MTSLLAYVGPETALPLMSLLAVLGGVLMMMGTRVKEFVVARVKGVWKR